MSRKVVICVFAFICIVSVSLTLAEGVSVDDIDDTSGFENAVNWLLSDEP